jgi:anti-anti-sigma regulatory factor
MVHEQGYQVEVGSLRPGVPMVRVRGRLDAGAAADLKSVVGERLGASPWALVVDLTDVAELRAAAVTALADLAARAGTADIGLYVVTSGGAVDVVLDDGEANGLFDIHHCVESADRALTMR